MGGQLLRGVGASLGAMLVSFERAHRRQNGRYGSAPQYFGACKPNRNQSSRQSISCVVRMWQVHSQVVRLMLHPGNYHQRLARRVRQGHEQFRLRNSADRTQVLHDHVATAEKVLFTQPGGTAYCNIFRTVYRDSPNSMATARLLLPSTRAACRTQPSTSTWNIPPVSHEFCCRSNNSRN